MLEWYEAYADYNDTMVRMENLVEAVALRGDRDDDDDVPRPRARPEGAVAPAALHRCAGRARPLDPRRGRAARGAGRARGRHARRQGLGAARRPRVQLLRRADAASQPTIVHDYPIEISPFARTTDDDETLTERFEYFAGGMELGNAFSEINDSEEQQERFRRQSELVGGEQEDPDYVEALSYGMPPTGGLGLGIDRLAMLLTGRETIRDVILLPGPEGPFLGGCPSAPALGPAGPLHRRRGRAPPRRRGHAAAGLDLPGRRVDRARPPGAAAGQRPARSRGRPRPRPSCSTAARSPSRRSGTSASTRRRRSCSTGSTSTAARDSSLVRIAVEAPSKEEARRTAQEAAEVATVLFNDRFAPQTTASVWEAASADEERVSPKPARNLALGLLLGALVGLAIVLVGLFRDVPTAVRARRGRAAPRTSPAAGRAAQTRPAPAESPHGPFTAGLGEWTVRRRRAAPGRAGRRLPRAARGAGAVSRLVPQRRRSRTGASRATSSS